MYFIEDLSGNLVKRYLLHTTENWKIWFRNENVLKNRRWQIIFEIK